MIKEAVVALLIENPDISKLTVLKITSQAGLNRATFYLHFLDIHDLLKQIVYEICDDLSLQISPLLQLNSLDQQEKLITFLDYFYSHRKLLAVLFEHPGFKKKLHMVLRDSFILQHEANEIDTSKKNLSMDIFAASTLGIIMWWIKDGNQHSSEYIASQMIELYR